VSKILEKESYTMREQCGTPAYIAPEILSGEYKGFSCDVWSSGVVLYSMLSGNVPFKGKDINDLHENIKKGNFNEIEGISFEAKNLIKKILEVNVKKRISIEEILKHSWFNNENYNSNNSDFNGDELFTKAEKIILNKSNVDYRDFKNKEDMIENFNIKNIDTNCIDDDNNINVSFKSFILAPFNSSINSNNNNNVSKEFYDLENKNILIRKNIIKFNNKVKEINRNFELNNNGEIDNGVVITNNSANNNNYNNNYNNNNNNNNYNNNNYNYNNYINNNISDDKYYSPNNEIEDNYNSNNMINNINIDINNNNDIINESILNEIEILGYNRKYVKECLEKNLFNYATTTYYLLLKYKNY
jgi:serine/threonine protein kinase